jgi:hypothetical protein
MGAGSGSGEGAARDEDCMARQAAKTTNLENESIFLCFFKVLEFLDRRVEKKSQLLGGVVRNLVHHCAGIEGPYIACSPAVAASKSSKRRLRRAEIRRILHDTASCFLRQEQGLDKQKGEEGERKKTVQHTRELKDKGETE